MKLDRKHIEAAARAWWKSLQPAVHNGRAYPGDRAALARLRRATDPLAAASEAAALDLYRRLDLAPRDVAATLGRVAVLASLLAHVRKDDSTPLGRALGPSKPSKKGETGDALLKPLRLARLLNARGDEEIGTAFRRAIALAGNTVNVGDIAWLVLTWDRDELGDRVRTLFAFDYHDATAHAPADDTSSTAASPQA